MRLTLRVAGLVASVVLMATGCTEASYTPPEAFCGVPVKSEVLSPMLPDGEKLRNRHDEAQSRPGAYCFMYVDGAQIFFATILYYDDHPMEPVDWGLVASRLSYPVKGGISFPGEGVIGSNGALVYPKCDSPTASMSVNFDLNDKFADNSRAGYRKLQRLINDFVPKVAKKYGCTT